ncbi:TPA: retroviral-like aspartic protease family protein [Stenotrophomonas maltophilia]|nr:retroviral-like aspartic protease family protein [Stenotrophomonas maltophilia]HDS1045022.1 retroviral-like aspartic protease family protein [Stenotrophomonas maltophilia]
MRLLISAAVALSLATPAGARGVIANDSHGITLAVMQGDSATLESIGKTKTPARLAARAGYHRVRGEIAKSNRWADTCIADAAVIAEKSQGVMYLCTSLRAGNRLVESDIQGWAGDMQKVRTLYQQHVAPSLGPGEEVIAITAPSFASFNQWPRSATLATPPSAGMRLPLSSKLGVPVLRGTISGGQDGKHRDIASDFIIDTGATRSHISRKAAQAMGLGVTDGFATDISRPDHPVNIGLAAPVDVKLGDLHFKNVAFTVTDEIEFNIIGLDLLYRLGPFLLKPDELQLLQSLPADACRQPLVTTSSLWGEQYSLRLPMRIGKRDEPVLLDTGTDVALEASGVNLGTYPQASLVQRHRWTMHGLQSVRYAEATAPVTFNGHTATLQTQVSDQPANVFPIAWRVGFGLRDSYDYYVDVAAARGCLVPRNT